MRMICGCRLIECKDGPGQGSGVEGSGSGGNPTIPLAVLFPAEGVEKTVRFGPYEIELAVGADPIGQNLSVVAISHGNSSTPWVFRDLAKHLAKAGFVVALPEHPGNNRRDNRLAGTVANLENRPRHISAVIDAVGSDPILSAHVAPANVGIIGHSIGAYTALAVAGGKPWSAPHESEDGKSRPVPVVSDKRVRSLVLLNPATFWFVPETLKDVRVPILILTGEKDEITPPALAQTVIDGVSDRILVEHKVIPGAGHFSFMSKFPTPMVRPDFPPSQDPPGFNRDDFQPTLFADIGAFFERTLRRLALGSPPNSR
jgi:predicted dienelactone hydrolase